MNIELLQKIPEAAETLIIPIFEKEAPPKELPQSLYSKVNQLLKTGEFEAKQGNYIVVHTQERIKRLFLVGLGCKLKANSNILRNAVADCARLSKQRNISSLVVMLPKLTEEEGFIIQATAEGLMLGQYLFEKFKTEKTDRKLISKAFILAKRTKENEAMLRLAKVNADSVMFARDLINMPASIMTPTKLAKVATSLKSKNMKVKILERKDMERLGMGGVLSVARGSVQPPKFIILEYKGSKQKSKPFVLVGKAITFDSGGLDIKPADGMKDMKSDMAGGATVLGILKTLQQLNLPLNVVGLIPATENMPGQDAYKQGDVVISYTKKTIEIGHTDAEGRIILADALGYAQKYSPKCIIDFATLTGACIIALGTVAAGLFSNNSKLAEKLEKASNQTQEKVWRMPLWDEYTEMIKGDIADVRNISIPPKQAGAITAAAFLKEFVGNNDWAHIDIAGPSYVDIEKGILQKGATGFGIRLLTRFLINETKNH